MHAGKEPDIQAEEAGSAQPGPSLRRVRIPALAENMGALAWVPVMGTERLKSSNDQKGHTWVLCLDEQKVLERTLSLSALVPLGSPRFPLTCCTEEGIHRGLVSFLLLQQKDLGYTWRGTGSRQEVLADQADQEELGDLTEIMLPIQRRG